MIAEAQTDRQQYTLPQLADRALKSVSALKEWYRLNKVNWEDLADTSLSSTDYLTDRQTEFFLSEYPPLSGQSPRQADRQKTAIADRQTDSIKDRQTETDRQKLQTEIADKDRQIEALKTDRDRWKQTVLDRQRQAEIDRQNNKTELDRLKQAAIDADRQAKEDKKADLALISAQNDELRARLAKLENQSDVLKESATESTIQLRQTELEKNATIERLSDRNAELTERLADLENKLDRQAKLQKIELNEKFEEYESAYQNQVTANEAQLKQTIETEKARLIKEHEAEKEAEKLKMFFERKDFAKYGLLLYTIIQVYVAGCFLNEYLMLYLPVALILGIPIAYGGLLSTMYLSDEADKNTYLKTFTGLFAVMEAAYFFPKCKIVIDATLSSTPEWSPAKIFGTLIYIVLMFVMGNSFGRIYFKIK